jgi:hypothetical protein
MKRDSQKQERGCGTAKGIVCLTVNTMGSAASGHEFYNTKYCDSLDRPLVDCGEINQSEGGSLSKRWHLLLNKQIFSMSLRAMSRLRAQSRRGPQWTVHLLGTFKLNSPHWERAA